MRRAGALSCVAAMALFGLWLAGRSRAPMQATATANDIAGDKHPGSHARFLESYGRLPMSFEANGGQADSRVNFVSRGRGYSLFLKSDEIVLALKKPTRKASSAPPAVVNMKLVNANPAAKVTGQEELPGKSNYFIGNEPRKWRTNVPNYAKVKFEGLYPGVDLIYYGNQGKIEYDFVIEPGGDPNVIALNFSGTGLIAEEGARTGSVRIDTRGDLVLGQGKGEVRFHKPVVYQVRGETQPGERELLEGSYRLAANNQVSFAIGAYDHSRILVIDPVLTYSTYLGGSGNDAGTNIAVDSSGNAYVVGTTTSPDFPTSGGAYQTSLADSGCTGVCGDVFVTKLAPTGSSAIFSTYIGGSGQDAGSAIAIDSTGNSYITGLTNSLNYPVVNALQPVYGGGTSDAFVTKLNSTGSALIYSTYLGGNGLDQGNDLAVDSSGEAYVVGGTQSSNYASPTSVGTCQGGGVFDAFVSKLNSAGNAFVYTTCLGGSGADQAYGVTLSTSTTYAYVVG